MKRWVNGMLVEPQEKPYPNTYKHVRPWRNKRGEIRWQPKDGHLFLWRAEGGKRWLESEFYGVYGPKLYKSRARAERQSMRRVKARVEKIESTFVPDE